MKRSGVYPVIRNADAEVRDFKQYGWKTLFAPVDIAAVVFFRIIFGGIMLWEMFRYFDHGWIERYWIEPENHFTYWPFDFLQPLPGNGMYILMALLAVAAFMIMTGLFYRAASIFFFFGFTYTYLLEQTRYLNHFYLVILISFVMMFIPANRAASIDAKRNPVLRSDNIPAWTLWLLRFTVAVPFFFGGVAKINPDWLAGEPMRSWLAEDTDFPVIGRYFTEEWMIYLISYAGLLLDLLIVPFLLIRKTRVVAFILGVLFHLMNSQLFTIGIFPWFMLIATSIFFNPSWPRKLFRFLFPTEKKQVAAYDWVQDKLSAGQKKILAGFIVFAAIQILLPLRHFFIPGDVHWTEEGHKYAWHMKLRSKHGYGEFIVRDKRTGYEEMIDHHDYIENWQYEKMLGWPNLVWQFAQIIKRDYARRGRDVAVFANVFASLNGREPQLLVDPNIDLGSVPRPIIAPAPWIISLNTPLSLQKHDHINHSSE